MKSKTKGYFYACISAGTYGLIPLFTLPIVAKGVGYDSILFYRFALATIFLAILMKIKGVPFRVKKTEILNLAILGFMYFGSSVFLIWSYKYMPAGLATTIMFLYPVFVVLVMGLLFKEKISWITCLSILGAVAGVFMLYGGGEGGYLSGIGLLLVLGSALSYGLYMIFVNKSSVGKMDGLKLTFYATLGTSILGLTKAIVGGGGLDLLPDMNSVWHILLLALIPTVLSCVTLAYAVQEIGATYTSALGALEPLTAVTVGIVAFSEPCTWNVICGISLIVVSVTVIVLWGMDRKKVYQ